MKFIIGDIGNTVTKISIFDNKTKKIVKIYNLETKKFFFTKHINKLLNEIKYIKNKSTLKYALFASVVPPTYLLIKNKFRKSLGIKCIEIKNKGIKHFLKIKISKPREVGSDRIANASGAYKIYKSNCIVIDFGTATTFDVVLKNGIYKGGIIAPGIELSLKNLNKATAKLPLIKLKKTNRVIGKNTIEAMSSGFFWGYLGLIKNIVKGIKKETDKDYNIICTGGFAKLFAKSIGKNIKINKDLTILGILRIYDFNRGFFK